MGCLFLVYRFARRWWGSWQALWSVLILLTSLEFFLLARIVISDMALSFCVTLTLYAFYSAVHAENDKSKRLFCLLMYGALSAGTLVKGLIGVVIPGMVILAYLVCTRKWGILRRLYPLPGALLFFVMVAPWYLWADARNPGYLRYYFWDEHFTRYLTSEFDREQSWFYFFVVVFVGFLPWSLCLPFVAKSLWRNLDDKNIFLILWVFLPFLFFSFSSSKAPQYLLPIYPALALLSAQTVAHLFDKPPSKERWLLYLPWMFPIPFIVYLLVGGLWQNLLPWPIRDDVNENLVFIGFSAAVMGLILGSFVWANLRDHGRSQLAAYLCSCGIALFFLLMGQLMITASGGRSSKALAQSAASLITHDSDIAIYDTYINGLIFYLRLDRPLWVVASPTKTTLMGSPYVSMQRPNPPPGRGKIIISFEEFETRWKNGKGPILVFAKRKNVARLESQLGGMTKELVRAGEYVLLSRPSAVGERTIPEPPIQP
jgi:4-amino-4-deoxy-L-arabinose transferase-like glycosyltransferase